MNKNLSNKLTDFYSKYKNDEIITFEEENFGIPFIGSTKDVLIKYGLPRCVKNVIEPKFETYDFNIIKQNLRLDKYRISKGWNGDTQYLENVYILGHIQSEVDIDLICVDFNYHESIIRVTVNDEEMLINNYIYLNSSFSNFILFTNEILTFLETLEKKYGFDGFKFPDKSSSLSYEEIVVKELKAHELFMRKVDESAFRFVSGRFKSVQREWDMFLSALNMGL